MSECGVSCVVWCVCAVSSLCVCPLFPYSLFSLHQWSVFCVVHVLRCCVLQYVIVLCVWLSVRV